MRARCGGSASGFANERACVVFATTEVVVEEECVQQEGPFACCAGVVVVVVVLACELRYVSSPPLAKLLTSV